MASDGYTSGVTAPGVGVGVGGIGAGRPPLRTISVNEETYRLLDQLRATDTEEDEFVVRRALMLLDVYAVIDYSLNTTTDIRKCERVARQMRSADYGQEKSGAICRALFGGQTERDMRKAFRFFDKDRNETISKKEFQEALPLMGDKVAPEKLDELFRLVDADKTGCIDFQEFCVLVKGMNSKDENDSFSAFRNTAEEGFNAVGSVVQDAGSYVSGFTAGWNIDIKGLGLFETRKAGIVLNKLKVAGYSEDDAGMICRVLFGHPTQRQFKRAFSCFDKDGNNYLDATEFKNALPLLGEDVPPDKVDELFRLVDQDGNGQVNHKEFIAVCQHLNPRAEKEAEEALRQRSSVAEGGSVFEAVSISDAWNKMSASWT